jgi:hypothetical protein
VKLQSPLEAARFLARWWPRRALLAPSGLPTCIESTRMAYDVFRAAGFLDVAPLSCEMVALNRRARIAIEQDRDIAGACRVSIGSQHEDGNPDGWQGHLILEHPAFLFDMTLPAAVASTGAKGFGDLDCYVAAKGTEALWIDDGSEGHWSSITDDGDVVMYRPTPENDEWKTLPGWLPSDIETVDMLADKVRQIAEGLTR